MAPFMKANLRMDKKQEMANLFFRMETYIKETSLMGFFMVKGQ